MNTRVNPFAVLTDPPVFDTKRKTEKPVAKETVDKIASDNNFPSRQAPKVVKSPGRKRRVYRTGRNQHLSIRATIKSVELFYKLADEQGVTLAVLFERALNALESSSGTRGDAPIVPGG